MALKVFITGASSGIGEALAVYYAAQGATLGLVARRADFLHGLNERLGGGHACYPLDVTDAPALHDAATDFMQRFGAPHIVIANAGVSAGTLTECEEDLAVFRRVMDTNVFGMAATFAPFIPAMRAAGGGDSVKALRSDMIFDMLAIRVLPEKAEGRHLVINWHFSDSGDKVASNLENCVLSYRLDCERADAQTQVRMPRAALVAVMTRQASLDELVTKGVLVIEGRREALGELFGMLDEFGVMFNIVEP